MNPIKNLKIYKKALAFFMAVSLMTSALPAFGEGEIEENTNETSITEVQDDQDEIVQRTYDDFENNNNSHFEELKNLSKKAKDYGSEFSEVYANLNYKEFAQVRNALASNGLVVSGDTEKSYRKSYLFVIFAMDHNIDMLYKKKYGSVIDISNYILDEKVKELAHAAFEKYIEVYEEGVIEGENFDKLVELLNEIKEKNFEAYYYYQVAMGYLCKHCVLVNYKKNQISKYFKYAKNNKLVLNIELTKYFEILSDESPDLMERCIVLNIEEYNELDNLYYADNYEEMIKTIREMILVK